MTSTGSTIVKHITHLLQLSPLEVDQSLSFLGLGGSSLDAIRLSQECKYSGIKLPVPDILRALSVSDLIGHALKHSNCSDTPQIPDPGVGSQYLQSSLDPILALPRVTTERYPMTEMQLSFIHGGHKCPGTNIIRHYQTCDLDKLPTLKHAWQTVLQAEPIFRTEFHLDNEEGYLIEKDYSAFSWTESTALTGDEYDSILKQIPTFTDVRSSFQVAIRNPNSCSPGMACIIWDVHHALVDGFSMGILLEKVEKVVRGEKIEMGPSFARLSKELRHLQKTNSVSGKSFWRDRMAKFSHASDTILLPAPRQDISEAAQCKQATFKPSVEWGQLRAHGQKLGVTAASIYLAAWPLVLSRLCDSETVVFGIVLSGRDLPLNNAVKTVGPLVNTLPHHVSLEESMTAAEYLRNFFSQLMELISYQWTTPEHGYSRQFSSAVAFQCEIALSDTLVGRNDRPPSTKINSEIPLSLMIEADGTIQLHYLSQAFSRDQIDLIGQQYCEAINYLCKPSFTVEMCLEAILSSRHRKRLLEAGNCSSGLTTATSIHDDLVTLFERTAKAHPTAVAVERSDQSMTYQQLDDYSSHIASYLKGIIQEGDIVCVHADQSIKWIIAIYGVLKAGGVYCPLNQNLTQALRNSMFESSRSNIFLAPNFSDKSFEPQNCGLFATVEALLLELDTNRIESPEWKKRTVATPAANAYLCFTSGSTGKPKGVLCTHRGLVAFQGDLEVRLFANPGRKIAQVMSVSFDGSIHELFSALSYGATLVLPDNTDPFAHLQLADSAILTPSVAKLLQPDDFPSLNTVYLVGEQVPQDVNDSWSSSKALYNMYGPTEATCGATIARLSPGKPVTLGNPNPSTRVYILNKKRKLVPPGIIGEIYLAGVQISNGYIFRPDVTRERFFDDSVCRGLGEKMYSTGDLGYWNDAGQLICLGRNDRQIKLRGFRVDLDDLEARLLQLTGVIAAAVVPKDDYLIAVVQPSSLVASEIRGLLPSVLPAHAIPKLLCAVDEFPMTPAGKRDYKQLVNLVQPSKGPIENPLTPLEKKIADIWAELLGLDDTSVIDADSSFTSLGGHSILQLRQASRLSLVLGCHVTPRAVIRTNTLRELAQHVESQCAGSPKSSRSVTPVKSNHEPDQLSSIETEWTVKYEIDKGTSAFNVSFVCKLDPHVERSRLVKAWNKVLARHQILRSRYVKRCHQGIRRAYSEYPPQVQLVRSLNLWKEVNRPFQLNNQDPIRVLLSPELLIVTASHVICDLTAMQLMLNEIMTIYRGESCLPSDRPYIESAAWHDADSSDLDFWSTYFDGVPEANFPLLRNFNMSRPSYHGTSYISKLDSQLSHGMNRCASELGITLHQLSIAAIALALEFESDDIDMVLGGPYLNRNSVNDMETVGLFLEPLPIRIKFPPDQGTNSSSSYLKSVKQTSQDALSHAVSWDQLQRHLGTEANFPDHPLFDVMVTFHDYKNSVKFPVEGVHPLYTWAEGSKFKLMFEFSAIAEDSVLLRIEYDDALFSGEEISQTEHLIVMAMGLLVKGMEWTEMKTLLRAAIRSQPDQSRKLDVKKVFGMKICDLNSA